MTIFPTEYSIDAQRWEKLIFDRFRVLKKKGGKRGFKSHDLSLKDPPMPRE